MDDNMARVREEARKLGGDELVAKIDAATKEERALVDKISAEIDGAVALPEGEVRDVTLAALSEALSTLLGRASVAYGKARKIDDAGVMVMSIRSLVNSIQIAFDDRDAADGDILSKIKSGFIPPKGDE
jgi:hypothetical protein